MFVRGGFTSEEKSSLVVEALSEARGSGEWVKANCPFCLSVRGRAGRSPALSISRTHGWYKCWRCGTKGKIDVQECDEQLAPIRVDQMELPPDFLALWESPGSDSEATLGARRYLDWRRVSESIIEDARIGFCVFGKYSGRVIVPIFSGDDDLVGWVGRSISPTTRLKYIYPKGAWRASALYNESALYVETDHPVFVVEGVFDALALWPNAVAVLGKPSHAQIRLIANANRPVVSLLDGDAWVESEALAGQLKILREDLLVGSVRLPNQKDPDDVLLSDLVSAGYESLHSSQIIFF